MSDNRMPQQVQWQSPKGPDAWEDEAEVEEFKPLTREDAQQWRKRQPKESAWRVVLWQVALALLAVGVAWLLTGRAAVAMSAGYGALCIVLPSALMAYGVTSSALAKVVTGVAKVSLAGVLFWEGIKILLALAMMWLAPKVIPNLSWLALVAGLVVVLKAYWLEFFMHSRRSA